MTRAQYREGDWFAVPLAGGGYAVGLVARKRPRGGLALGYFFGPRRARIPSIAELATLRPGDAVLCERSSDLGLIDGNWPLIGHDQWHRDRWPIPAFGRLSELEGKAWKVEYADDDPGRLIRETAVAPEEIDRMPRDGSSGAEAIEIALSHSVPASPEVGDDIDPGRRDQRTLARPTASHYLYFPQEAQATGIARNLQDADTPLRFAVRHRTGWFSRLAPTNMISGRSSLKRMSSAALQRPKVANTTAGSAMSANRPLARLTLHDSP